MELRRRDPHGSRLSLKRYWAPLTFYHSWRPPMQPTASFVHNLNRPADRSAATICSSLLRPSHSAIPWLPTMKESSPASAAFLARTGCGRKDQGVETDRLGSSGAIDPADAFTRALSRWRDLPPHGHGIGRG